MPGAVVIGGLVPAPLTLHIADLQQLPAETQTVSFTAGGSLENHSFKGTRLINVLNAAHVGFDPSRKNASGRAFVEVTGSDGYQAILAYGDIDPNFGNQAVLLAYEQDGKTLTDQDGPRLTVPGDKAGGRYVSGVVRVDVKDAEGTPFIAAPSAAASAAAAAKPSASGAAATVSAGSAATGSAAASGAAAANPSATGAATTAAAPKISGNLTVFAAASLTDAFNQMKANIEAANPGVTVTMNYAGSQVLRTQLAQGAKADIFASADTANMDGATSDGSIDGQPVIFAHNRLAVVVPANGTKVAALKDLANPGVKLVIEQPSVPAGNYSRQALMKMAQDPTFGANFSDKVLANVVSQEADVKSVLSRIQLGEADAGMLYTSDILTAQPGTVKSIAIPDQYNVIADYPIGVVKNAPNAAGAKTFISYVTAASGGQAILQKFGLLPVIG
ncbi:MAG: molybdate ABC transporter substrate-binding protein [Chloroflexi bacterium]|nr:molybdate ABC transporter substrate-binding protein [Chloroflexota bacterium]